MASVRARERKRATDVAREYAGRGYDVTREPGERDLPSFLSGLQPDLIARKGDDLVVIEVRSEESLAGRRDLQALAEAVEKAPGWRFELVVTNPRRHPLEGDPRSKQIRWNQIGSAASEVEALLAARQGSGATIQAWALAEATLRLAAKRMGVDVERADTVALLKTTYSLGVVTREEMDVLEQLLSARNRAAHGAGDPPGGTRLVRRSLQIVRRLKVSAEAIQTMRRRLERSKEFREEVISRLRDETWPNVLQYVPLGGATVDVSNEMLEQVDVDDVELGAVQYIDDEVVVLDGYATVHVVVTFLVDPDYLDELDPDFEVVLPDAASHASQVEIERDLTADFTLTFDRATTNVTEVELVHAALQ